ncbi:MAG: ABC transporter permease [Calditrichia bacterium]
MKNTTVNGLNYYLNLLRELLIRDIKVRYKRSVLGVAWAVITPVLHLLIFYFLFQLVFSLSIPNYASFAFIGMLSWVWFQSSLSQAAASITDNKQLLVQPGFPRSILPLVAVVQNMINFVLSLPFLFIVLALEGIQFNLSLLFFPLLMMVQLLFTLGLAYFSGALNVLFRDTQHLLVVILQLWFFLTPIFYDAKVVPEPYHQVYLLNPLFHIVNSYRDSLMYGRTPDVAALLSLTVISLLVLIFSLKFFRRISYRFFEEI